MLKLQKFILLFFISLLAGIVGCTKKSNSPQVIIDVRSVSQQKNSAYALILEKAILQLSRDGQVTRKIVQDCKIQGTNPCGLFEVKDLAPGPVKFQLLAMYSENGNKFLYYDAPVADLKGGGAEPVVVNIKLKKFANVNSRFVGKYVPESGTLQGKQLTGKITSTFKPLNDPEIELNTFAVYAGMFSQPLITPVLNLGSGRYYFSGWDSLANFYNKVQILQDVDPNGLTTLSAQLQNRDRSLIKVIVPDRHITHSAPPPNSPEPTHFEKSENLLVGFLGLNRAGKKVCWDDTSAEVFDSTNDFAIWCTDQDCLSQTYINWPAGLSSGTGASDIQFQAVSSPNDCSTEFGGATTAAANSFGYNQILPLFREFLPLVPSSEGLAGVVGPFRSFSNGTEWDIVHHQQIASQDSLLVRLHMGIPVGSAVTAYVSATAVNPEPFFDSELDILSCNKVVASGLFTEIGATSTVATDREYKIDLYAAEQAGLISPDSHLAICARGPGGNFLGQAIYFPVDNGNQQTSPLKLSIYRTDSILLGDYDYDSVPLEFQPAYGSTSSYFLVLKNISNASISLDETAPFHYAFNSHVSISATFAYDNLSPPAVTPAGGSYIANNSIPMCDPDPSQLGSTMDLSVGQECYIVIDFSAGTPSDPQSFVDSFNVVLDTAPPGQNHSGFNVIGPTYVPVVEAPPSNIITDIGVDTIGDLTFDAPPGEKDSKWLKISSSSNAIDFTGITISGTDASRFAFGDASNNSLGLPDCADSAVISATPSVAASNGCMLKLIYTAPTTGYPESNADLVFAGWSVSPAGPGSDTLSLVGTTSLIISAPASPNLSMDSTSRYNWDFGSVPISAHVPLVYASSVSSTALDPIIFGASSVVGSYFSLNDYTGVGAPPGCVIGSFPMLLATSGTSCDFSIKVSSPTGPTSGHFWIYYSSNGSFRPFEFFVKASN